MGGRRREGGHHRSAVGRGRSQRIASAVTDVNGNFHFENVAAGLYLAEFARPAESGSPPPTPPRPTSTATPTRPTGASGRGVRQRHRPRRRVLPQQHPKQLPKHARAHKNTPTVGNVLAGATDPNADTLVAHRYRTDTRHTRPEPRRFVQLHPEHRLRGHRLVRLRAVDGYGGTDTATVESPWRTPPRRSVRATATPPRYGLDRGRRGRCAVQRHRPEQRHPHAMLASGPQHGTLVLNDDGSFSYIPDDDFVGTDSFSYCPTDDDGPGAATFVNLTVTDHPPEAVNDSANVNEDGPVTLSVLTNDTDPDDDTLTVLGASDGLFGTTVVNLDGTITYTPYADFNGTDTFVYAVDDGFGGWVYATVTVTVAPVNDAPTIDPAPVFVQKDTPLDIDLRTLVNDVETALDNLTFAVSNALNGTIQLLADGRTARFTPTTGYYGAANFSLAVTDTGDGSSSASTTNATVSTPVNAPPTASDGAATFHLAPGASATVYAAWSNPDGDPLTVSIVQPAHGSVALNAAGTGFVYTAGSPAYVGAVTFEYTVSDGRGGTATGLITVTLTNQPPTGTNVELFVSNRRATLITPSYSDPDGDPLTITQIVQPASGSGTVTIAPQGGVLYTPPVGFTGQVTFSFTVDDGHGGTLTIYVTLTVA